MTLKPKLLAALILAASVASAPAIQQVKSLYTAIDLKACKTVAVHDHGAAWLCDGLEGYPVYIAEGDLRIYLSVGPRAGETRAAKQTLSSFNTLFEDNSSRTTVEWRFIIRDGRTVPYATIVRYFTDTGSERGEVLVVMRVTETEACHVAYIDALANADAIVLARQVADRKARAFRCDSDPTVEGRTSKSPM